MFISIIIPTLNEENYIGSLLNFLSDHPQKSQFEVIVVDGGSDDKTIQIVKNSSHKLILAHTRSRAHQMNLGAKHAKGKTLYFVHADTQLVSDFVFDIEKAIAKGFRSGCYRFKFDNPKNPLLHINGFFTRFPFMWCRGGDQTLFITKSSFELLGGFNEQFVIMEDYDILQRIHEQGVPFRVIPKSVKVSARKYDCNSYLKVQLANLRAMKMYKKGASPILIKEYYTSTLSN